MAKKNKQETEPFIHTIKGYIAYDYVRGIPFWRTASDLKVQARNNTRAYFKENYQSMEPYIEIVDVEINLKYLPHQDADEVPVNEDVPI